MNILRVSRQPNNHLERQSAPGSQHHRRLFLLTRITCIIVDVLTLGLFVVTLPTYFAYLRTPCTNSCITGQISTASLHALFTLGLSLNNYAFLGTAIVVIAVLPCVVIAALLLWRQSDSWTALLVAVMLVGLSTSTSLADELVLRPLLGPTLSLVVSSISNYIGATSLALIISLFPTGRFVPRWTGWLVIAMLITAIVFTLPLPSSTSPNALNLVSSLIWLSCLLSLVGAQIYRYLRVSTLLERQQTKWVIFGFSVALLTSLAFFLPFIFFPSFQQFNSPYYPLWTLIVSFTLPLPIALSFGLAILRYRLYNIDVIINRSLIYGLLTITLALIYFGLVFTLQFLTRLFIGQAQDNPLVIVSSTLVIAALFTPLRLRIQAFIDRRFYRRKYNAERTLETFNASLRDELDLSQLSEQLLMAVQDTMQPSHVSLWLRPPQQAGKPPLTRKLPLQDDRMEGSVAKKF